MKKELYQKSGNIGESANQIIVLIVGVAVAILVIIFVGSMGGQTYNLVQHDIEALANNSITNQTFTADNLTTYATGHFPIQTGTLEIWNASTQIGLGNFTVNYDLGTFLLNPGVPSTQFNSTSMNATFTWGNDVVRDAIKGSITSGFQGLEQTGDYLPVIVMAVIIAIVIGSILMGIGGFGGIGGNRGSAL